MAKIQFQTNVPVELRLQSIEGEVTPSQFGGNQIKFTAHEGPFWVSEAVGSILIDQIRKKRIQPHVPVEVARREIAQSNGRKGIQWSIDPVGFAPGEQPDGTFAVPTSLVAMRDKNGANGHAPSAPQAAPKAQPSCADNNVNGNANGAAAPASERSKTKLEDALKTVVAACHAAREYAKQIGYEGMPPFTSEDIRTMANTLMIQNGNGGLR